MVRSAPAPAPAPAVAPTLAVAPAPAPTPTPNVCDKTKGVKNKILAVLAAGGLVVGTAGVVAVGVVAVGVIAANKLGVFDNADDEAPTGTVTSTDQEAEMTETTEEEKSASPSYACTEAQNRLIEEAKGSVAPKLADSPRLQSLYAERMDAYSSLPSTVPEGLGSTIKDMNIVCLPKNEEILGPGRLAYQEVLAKFVPDTDNDGKTDLAIAPAAFQEYKNYPYDTITVALITMGTCISENYPFLCTEYGYTGTGTNHYPNGYPGIVGSVAEVIVYDDAL